MRPTRRSWAVGGLILLLAILAVIFDRPTMLVGAVLIGAWLCTRQYLFFRELTTTTESLTVSQNPALTGLRTNESTTVTMEATLDQPVSLSLSIEAGLPVSTSPDQSLDLVLEAGSITTQATADVSWPVAGRHTFSKARLTASDGLFTETLATGSTPTVTVEPRGPRSIHVGSGGDRVPIRQGHHQAGKAGSGLVPAEIREYVPGETTARIHWKATARLATPHVRKFDAETDRLTLMFVDHSRTLAVGSPGETQLDYLREIALITTSSAHHLGDPIGLCTVDDDGITSQFDPSTGSRHQIRRRLFDLEPVGDETGSAGTSAADGIGPHGYRGGGAHDQTTLARRILTAEADSMTDTLGPFYEAYRTGDRFSGDGESLPTAVRTVLNRHRTCAWVVLLTNDSNPVALRRTVRLAREANSDVLVFLTPTVLYEPSGLSDLEGAYERYLEFEALRRELDRMERVTALEVAPNDRLTSVLAVGRNRRGERP
ncbi:DUF58 domain-containing protein [Natrialbaceae archaeon A-CW1-1]